MQKLNFGKRACAVSILCATTAITLPAQTFTTVHRFDYTDGINPNAALVQATDGSLYGTASDGGAGAYGGSGTVFKITPDGMLTTLYSFCSLSNCVDGEYPYGGVVQSFDGNFYGTTPWGGANDNGTVFKITPSGTLTTLHSFDFTDGYFPDGALLQASDGNFYGTTLYGGANASCEGNGCGTVFKISREGTLTTLYSFCAQSGCADGYLPNATLVRARDGDFYGTTQNGGANSSCEGGHGCGTVFKITPTGTLTTIYSSCSQFGCVDGANPSLGALIQATDGNFYGTTLFGGANDSGTVFKITSRGTLTTLYSFCSQDGCTDGLSPDAGLIQATDGNFYGTTYEGGANTTGTVFKITSRGTLTTLYTFCSRSACRDGSYPLAALVQDTNGKFYGTTYEGGANCGERQLGCGTVFSLSVGSNSFVETQPTYGRVGRAIKILGTNLGGATSVTFNGTPAVFSVVSSSLITTSVPEGATSGRVQVTINNLTLSSNVPFQVIP